MASGRDDADRTATSDFLLQKYQLDRAHELELNKFTHRLEMERLKLLLALNGGAAGLWVTFAQSEGSALGAPALALPVIFWIIGVIAASVAIDHTLKSQRGFTQAYHRRRRADEWRLLSQDLSLAAIAAILPKPDKDSGPEAAERDYRAVANAARAEGEAAGKRVKGWVYASIMAFAVGAIVALIGMTGS